MNINLSKIPGVFVSNLDKVKDDRGWLAEVYRSDEFTHRPEMMYASITKTGIVRGPHEHEHQTDMFLFMGPGLFEITLWCRRAELSSGNYQMEKWTGGSGLPLLVIIPPGVVHGYKNVSPVDGLVLNLPDKLYKGNLKLEKVDEIRWEGVPDSPFRI